MTIKKKLRDLAEEELDNWIKKVCHSNRLPCEKCPFKGANCDSSDVIFSWINNKDVYSDKFLNQEIEIEEGEDYE